ncbi:hypothetical protein EC968_009042 [Mortierella alpina]|nr:hypothetical protein EC968_009042 [Mortierella alpina]
MRDPDRADSSSSNQPQFYQSDQQLAPQQYRQQPQNQLYWSTPQASLQQHHGARLHSEYMHSLRQQRVQQDLIGRSCPNLQYEQHSHQGGASTQFLTVETQQLPSDAQYVGMNDGSSGASALESYRTHRWSEAGRHDSLVTDDNEEMDAEGRYYQQQNDLSWGYEGARSAVHQDHEMDDDCTPSGLVGIPQEVRRLDRRSVSRVPGAQQRFPSQHPHHGSGFQLRPAPNFYEPLHQGQPSDQGSRDPTEGDIQEMQNQDYYVRHSAQGSALRTLGPAVYPSGYPPPFDPYASHGSAPHVSALQGARQPDNDRFRQAPSDFMSGNAPVVSRHEDTRDGARKVLGQGEPSRQSKHEDHNERENSELT